MRTGSLITLLLLFSPITFAAEVTCLDVEQGREVLVDGREASYFSRLEPREMQAKSGRQPPAADLGEQRQWLRSVYADAIRDCSAAEEQALQWYVSHLEEALAARYPGLFRLPWRFIKVTNAVESGFPHTAGEAIVLSAAFIDYIRQTQSAPRHELLNLLVHEQVHVLQRDDMTPYRQVYEEVFGFRRAVSLHGFEPWLASHQVVNPDGIAVDWVWPVPGSEQVIWPRLLLRPGEGVMSLQGNLAMVAISLTPKEQGYAVVDSGEGRPQLASLIDNEAYRERFSGVSSLYHPNEIAADSIAALMLRDGFGFSGTSKPEKYAGPIWEWERLRPWVKRLLGEEA